MELKCDKCGKNYSAPSVSQTSCPHCEPSKGGLSDLAAAIPASKAGGDDWDDLLPADPTQLGNENHGEELELFDDLEPLDDLLPGDSSKAAAGSDQNEDHGIVDLPGLPEVDSLPATETHSSIDLAGFDLDGAVDEMDLAQPDHASPELPDLLDLETEGGAFDDLPAPVFAADEADLPAPILDGDLPAPVESGFSEPATYELDLPTPKEDGGLPKPVGEKSDLPSPKGGDGSFELDLPGPDLPTPRGDSSAPDTTTNEDGKSGMTFGEVDLSVELPPDPTEMLGHDIEGLDDLTESEANLEAQLPPDPTDFELPPPPDMPVAQDTSLPPPAPQNEGDSSEEENILLFERGDKPPLDVLPSTEIEQLPEKPTKKERRRARLPLMIGIGTLSFVLLAGIFLGIFTSYGLFGYKLFTGAAQRESAARQSIEDGRLSIQQDSLRSYQAAVVSLTSASENLKDNTLPLSLKAQALAAQAFRFRDSKTRTEATNIVDDLTATKDPIPELAVARSLVDLASKRVKKATASLRQQSKANPNDTAVATFAAWGDLAQKRLAPAIATFRKVLKKEANHGAALFGIARALFHQGKLDDSRVYLTRLRRQVADHVGARLLHCELLLSQGNLEEAASGYRAIVKMKQAAAPFEVAEAYVALAKLAKQEGLNNDARKNYRAAISHDAFNADAQLGLGTLFFASGHHSKALTHLNRALAQRKTDTAIAVMIARAQLALGRPAAARKAIKRLSKKMAKSAEVRFLLGRADEETGKLKRAAKHYRAAIKSKPDIFAPYLHLSRVLIKQKKKKDAFALLGEAKKAIPNSAEVHNAFGEAFLRHRKYDDAIASFSEALRLDSGLNSAAFNLGSTLRRQGNTRRAIDRLEQLEQRDREYPGLASELGKAYFAANRYDAAADAYERALALDTPTTEARVWASRAFNRSGRFKKAITQTELILKDEPANANARAYHAEARLGQGKARIALVEIRQALERGANPNYFEIQGRVFQALNRNAEAISALTKALKSHPKDDGIRILRGKLLVREGAVKDGLAELRKVSTQNPRLAEPFLYIGIAHRDLGQEDAAVAAFHQALKRNNKEAEAHLRLGEIYRDRLKYAQALLHLKDAVEYAPKKSRWLPDAYFLLAKVARQQNMRLLAITALKNFEKTAPPKHADRAAVRKELNELGAK